MHNLSLTHMHVRAHTHTNKQAYKRTNKTLYSVNVFQLTGSVIQADVEKFAANLMVIHNTNFPDGPVDPSKASNSSQPSIMHELWRLMCCSKSITITRPTKLLIPIDTRRRQTCVEDAQHTQYIYIHTMYKQVQGCMYRMLNPVSLYETHTCL